MYLQKLEKCTTYTEKMYFENGILTHVRSFRNDMLVDDLLYFTANTNTEAPIYMCRRFDRSESRLADEIYIGASTCPHLETKKLPAIVDYLKEKGLC